MNKFYISKIYDDYLIYIENYGFILAHKTNANTFWKKIIKSQRKLDEFNNDYNEFEETREMYNFIDGIYKVNKSLYKLASDLGKAEREEKQSNENLVQDLIEELLNIDYTKGYSKFQDIEEPEIKKWVINPEKTFKQEEETEEILDKEEFEKAKIKYNDELNDLKEQFIKLTTKAKNVVGYNKQNNEANITNNKQIMKNISELTELIDNNPILNMNLGIGNDKRNKIRGSEEIIKEFNIKRTINNNEEEIYFYNNKLRYYDELDEMKLKTLIKETYGLTILESDINAMFHAISINNKMYTNLLVFNNCLFDINSLEVFKEKEEEYFININDDINSERAKEDFNNELRKKYLSENRIGSEEKDGTIHLLNYNKDLDLTSITKVKRIPEKDINEFTPETIEEYSKKYGMTYTEKVLRQILIPKSEPENLSYFIDFLERVGSCIYGENIYKDITLYYGDGNNAKGELKIFNELLFNNMSKSIKPDDLKDNFSIPTYKNKKCIIFDEISKDSFNDLKPDLKRMVSKSGRREQRIIHSKKVAKQDNFPNIWILTNELLNINLDEKPLFRRITAIKLPNEFVDTEEELNINDNTYLVDPQIENKIKKDYIGLSWLISASIKMFKNMKEDNKRFLCYQTVEETMDIFLNTDYLTKFLTIYTEKDLNLTPDEYVTNDEIKQHYKHYMQLQGKTINEKEVTKQIGIKLKEIYGIEGKLTDEKNKNFYHKLNNRKSSYSIIIKTTEELEKQVKQKYIITDITNENKLKYFKYNDNERIVYNKIKNKCNTIELLQKELPEYNIFRIIKNLENNNFIELDEQTNLNSY